MYPEYYQKRLEMIDYNAEIQKRFAKLKLLVPQNKDDLWLLYNYHQGRIVPDGRALWDPDPQTVGDLNRGLLNLHNFLKENLTVGNPSANPKDADFKGILQMRPGGAPLGVGAINRSRTGPLPVGASGRDQLRYLRFPEA